MGSRRKTPIFSNVMPDPDRKYPWEDLRAPASAINPAGQTAGADIDSEDSTLLFSSSATETVAAIFQMPHHWWEGSDIRPHIHWAKTTDASGDVSWEIRYKVCAVGSVYPAYSDWLSATGRSSEPGATQTHVIDKFADIDMDGKPVSSIVVIQLRRDHDDTADDYGADARLLEIDLHYQVDSLGSIEEYTKDTDDEP